MRYRFVLVALALLAAVAGCAAERPEPVALTAPGAVLTLDGVGDVAFGASAPTLTAQGRLARPEGACGPVLTGRPEVSPVFADDRLVLLWADRPLTTSEGVGVDSPVAHVRAAYPQAQERPAPAGSHRFDALTVTEDDRSYVFLHDGETVRKTVAGFTRYTDRLLDSGFGAC